VAAIALLSTTTGFPVAFTPALAASVLVQIHVSKLPGIWSHTWSLAIEKHLYLFIRILFLLLLRSRLNSPFRVALVCFVFVAIDALILRLINARPHHYTPVSDIFLTPLRVDSRFFGVILEYVYNPTANRAGC
jgi:peptidoglycan/LPS O-acetylase OafA/YrhL